jgi:hypothetical protein
MKKLQEEKFPSGNDNLHWQLAADFDPKNIAEFLFADLEKTPPQMQVIFGL